MRTLTTLEAKLYDIVRMAAHVRVKIRDAFYVWRDLTDIVGKDWLLGVEWDENIDQPVAQCTVTLVRDSYKDTLGLVSATRPNLLNGSYSQLVRAGLEFVVEVALMPEMIQPSAGNWREVFRGDIQRVSYGPNPMSFTGMDLGRRLQTLFIEEDREYGSTMGVAIETVMQQIINDNHAEEWTSGATYSAGSPTAAPSRVRPTAGNETGFWYRCDADGTADSFEPAWPTNIGDTVTDGSTSWTCAGYLPILYVPVSPGFLIRPEYQQRKESVMDALKNLALNNLGWDVRYRWREATGKSELTFSAPDRATTTAVYTFGPDQYFDVQALDVDSIDVRNAVEGVYSDSADLDLRGIPKRKTIRLEDPTSQAKYTFGQPAWSQIAEPATSQIDTSSEMTDLLEAMLSDLAEPVAEQAIRMPYWYPGELWDLYAFSANGVHYDSEQKFAVTQMRHRFYGTDMPETVLYTRGKPAVAVEGWIRREARPGGAMLSPFIGPDAPTDVEVLPVVGGFDVTFVPPRVGKWEEFEVHASESSGFTPDDTTVQAIGKATTITVSSLTPGTAYYIKVVPRDSLRNRGTASAEESLAAGYTTPRSLQPLSDLSSFPLNGDFEADGDGDGVPDSWTTTVGSFGSTWDWSGDPFNGVRAAKFLANQASTITSPLFAVEPSTRYLLSWYVKLSALVADSLVATVYFQDEGGGSVGTLGSSSAGFTAGAFNELWTIGDSPATARKAYVEIAIASKARIAHVDLVKVTKLSVRQEAFFIDPGATLQNSWTNYNTPTEHQVEYMRDSNGFVHIRGSMKNGTIGATAFVLPTGYRPSALENFATFGSDGSNAVLTHIQVSAAGVVVVVEGDNTRVSLDGITFKAG